MSYTEKEKREQQCEYLRDMGADAVSFLQAGNDVSVAAKFSDTFSITFDDLDFIKDIIGRIPVISINNAGTEEKTVNMTYRYQM